MAERHHQPGRNGEPLINSLSTDSFALGVGLNALILSSGDKNVFTCLCLWNIGTFTTAGKFQQNRNLARVHSFNSGI